MGRDLTLDLARRVATRLARSRVRSLPNSPPAEMPGSFPPWPGPRRTVGLGLARGPHSRITCPPPG
ncbi:hypothetical protein [Thermus scotoductus]|uniref:hypothetical protein n=1 Tax=Thermus scotoductus TaxID=37636 RepID=UPI0020A4B8FF|nr:hypothetical protein [Thermus scotoductus]